MDSKGGGGPQEPGTASHCVGRIFIILEEDLVVRLFTVQGDDTKSWLCYSPMDLAVGVGDACIVEYEKIPDFGHVTMIEGEAAEPPREAAMILRRATLQDQSRAGENTLFNKRALRLCQEKIKALKLVMRLIRVRYSFDRAHLTVVFTAEERVDFRQLIQDLATETHARVEMRQIGVRDAAATFGGMAPCGRALCCATWLQDFENINIRMAKTQGLSLNPSTINGMCGRLKCCLKYEYQCYRDLCACLPNPGCRVESPEGPGKVIETRVLPQKVRIVLDDRRVVECEAKDVKTLGKPPQKDHTQHP